MTNTLENTLCIIGNGFDLNFGLKTKTTDYIKILEGYRAYNSNESVASLLTCYGVNWSDYELTLGQIDLSGLIDDNIQHPDYQSDYEYDRDSTIWNMEEIASNIQQSIFDALDIMVDDANICLSEISNKHRNIFENCNNIISFNYTSTIEKLFDIANSTKIIHIHGCRENGDQLIYGYKDDTQYAETKENLFEETKIK